MSPPLAAALPLAPALALALAGGGSEPEAPLPGASGDVVPAQVAARPAAFAQCASCHAVVPGRNGIGPSLAGVVGAPAARDPQFAYSTAMRGSGLTWDEATLDAYLKDPRAVVPGTKMAYTGLKDDAARAQLIAWLKTI